MLWVSRADISPIQEKRKAIKIILKYLRRTKDIFLIYGNGELKLEGYIDSSFQSDIDDSKSMSGYIFTLNGGAVSWKSSKQETTADSTTEAEYIAASDAAKEVVWIRNFIQALDVIPSIIDPVMIYYSDVIVDWVASAKNVADPLTKPLAQKIFDGHLEKMGLRYMGNWS